MDQQVDPRSKAVVFEWPTVGRPGVVPLDTIVPDPEQPRIYFDKDELTLLAKTMKAKGQREIITVRELTPEERIKYPSPARYMIVSGERRWRATREANLRDIEIRVKAYESRAEQMMDAYMLNEGRVGLSDIEHALYLAKLMTEFGWETQGELAEHIGRSPFWVSDHLALLKLAPVVRQWMMPDVPEENRLKIQPALRLSRDVKDFSTQEDLVARMPKNMSGIQQVAWLRSEFKKLGIENTTRKRSPSGHRKLALRFVMYAEYRIDWLLGTEGIDRLFENATLKQTDELVNKTTVSLSKLQELIKKIRQLADDHKLELAEKDRLASQTSVQKVQEREGKKQAKEAARLERHKRFEEARQWRKEERELEKAERKANRLRKRTLRLEAAARKREEKARRKKAKEVKPLEPKQEPSIQELPPPRSPISVVQKVKPPPPLTVSEPPEKKHPVAAPFDIRKGESIFGTQTPRPVLNQPHNEVVVEYYDEKAGRLVMDKISIRRYIEFWDKGLLKFQQQKIPKPAHLPTREEALTRL